MNLPQISLSDPKALMYWLVPFLLWELVWKGFALWRTGRNNQPYWFIAILLINSVGILPIVYLLFFSKTHKQEIHEP